jgi:hypothetical protein
MRKEWKVTFVRKKYLPSLLDALKRKAFVPSWSILTALNALTTLFLVVATL